MQTQPPRQLSPRVIAEIRREVDRLALSDNPAVLNFVERMRAKYPELKQPKVVADDHHAF